MEHENDYSRPFMRLEQPWLDAELARLYDAFPFTEDIPLYVSLASEEGGKVLELGCGSGRVLVPLAQAGHRVVGIDASPHMLELARKKIESAGEDVEARARLVRADMRDFDLGERFDLAVIAVKSLAYLTERADQLRALRNMAAHLRNGGLLAIDQIHPTIAWLSRRPGEVYQDLVQRLEPEGRTVVRTETVVDIDFARQVRLTRSIYEVIDRDGGVRKRIVEWPYRYTYRFEMELLLECAGFKVEALYGGYRREPFTSESPHMLFLARRSAA